MYQVIEREGFYTMRSLSGSEYLKIRGDWSDEIIDVVINRNIKHLIVSSFNERYLSKLKILDGIVERVDFSDYSVEDYSALNDIHSLRELYTVNSPVGLDYSSFPDLIKVGFSSSSIPDTLRFSPQLDSVSIIGYRGIDFVEFSDLKKVKCIHLNDSAISSFYGIESIVGLNELCMVRSRVSKIDCSGQMDSMKSLTLAASRHLVDLSRMFLFPNLEDLDIERSRSVLVVDAISTVKSLKFLNINDIGTVSSIRPLACLSTLERLSMFGDTNVFDGDVRCMLDCPRLQFFGFKNRKHYNDRMKDMGLCAPPPGLSNVTKRY